jgi:hypothetical protein
MEGIQRCGADRRCALERSDVQFQQASTRLNALSISEEQSSEITIVTDEGDTVMLSSRQNAEVDLLTYEHLVCADRGFRGENVQMVDFEAEREFTLAVQGDLNDQELADIQTLLKDLGDMLKAFLTGEDEGDVSLAIAESIDRCGSLSAFKADFEYRVSLGYLNFEAEQLTLARTGSPQRPAPFEAEAASMAKRTREAGVQGHRRLKHLKKFLQVFLKVMHANQVIDTRQVQRGQRVIEKFMNTLQKSADTGEVQPSRLALNRPVAGHAYGTTHTAALEPAVVEAV